jgi:hypothetical protein
MLDPIIVGIISAIAGYKIGNSTCLYGLCSVSNVELEMDKEKDVANSVNSVNENSNKV